MKNSLTKNTTLITAILFMVAINSSYAQISPPGLGKAKNSSWFAFGVKQSMDSLKHIESTTYIGIGRKSNPDESNPSSKMAIFVINQEISHRYRQNWE